MSHRRIRVASLLLLTGFLGSFWGHHQSALAQDLKDNKLTKGFTVLIPAELSGKELTQQPRIWAYEVSYRPMRLMWLEVTNPVTKQKERKLVWYLVYKATLPAVFRPKVDTEREPENVRDAEPVNVLVPEITLITEDDNNFRVHPDQVIPEAQEAIIEREKLLLKNSNQNTTDIDNLVELETGDPAPDQSSQKDVYGVATWTDIDPATDFFSLYFSGFSNGYRVKQGPNNSELIERRIIVQKCWRPGDEFEQDEKEFRFVGKPEWVYIPEPAESSEGNSSNASGNASPGAGEGSPQPNTNPPPE